MKKYFVVSLPRTGTKSLCKMANILGLLYKHAPSVALERIMRSEPVRFFADTPIYRPSVFKALAEDDSNYFIYIDRPIDTWVDSFERVNLHKSYMYLISGTMAENPINRLDRDSLSEVFHNQQYTTDMAKECFTEHRELVHTIIPENRLLVYYFDMGWDPFVKFLDSDIPENTIPHLNINTMFEKI